MISVYGIRNCDTIKKTLGWLQENGFANRFHDYRKDGIDEKLVREFMAHFTLDELINRRGTTWRKLPESLRENLTADSALTLMLENPAVIKRPILCDGKHWLIGFKPDAISSMLTSR